MIIRKTVILAYKDWVFRGSGKKAEPFLTKAFDEEHIISPDYPSITLTKRSFTGTRVNFYYYSPLSAEDDSAAAIVKEIQRDIAKLDRDIVILLHTGSGAITFEDTALEDFVSDENQIKVDFFSGGDGISYTELLSNGATIFPSIPSDEISAAKMEDKVELVWDHYSYGQTEAIKKLKDKFNR